MFRARRRTDGAEHVVVLKQLGPLDEETERRIRRNVRRLLPLQDRHLAPLLEVFRGPGLFGSSVPDEQDADLLYVVSRWVDGQTLWSCQERFVGNWERVLGDLVDAVEALHGADLTHGDIHPANIVLTDEGAVLIDLEQATDATSDEGPRSTGIAGFIPPELEFGETPTQASDRWQVGMVAARLLLGHPMGRLGHASLENELSSVHGRRRGKRLAAVLAQLLQEDPDRRPVGLGRWASDLSDAWIGVRRRLATAALIVASLLLVTGAVAVLLTPDADRDGSTTNAGGTTHGAPPAASITEAACEQQTLPTSELSREMRSRWESVGPVVNSMVEEETCLGEPFAFSSALVIPLTTSGEPDGVVMAGPETRPTELTERQWLSYRDIAGRERPENAVDLGGYPTAVTNHRGSVRIELSGGGLMIALDEQMQAFWIPEQLRGFWEAAGGIDGQLGFPASNPFFFESHIVQDFEHAEVRTSPDAIYRTADDIDFEVVDPDDPAAPLAAIEDLRGRIIRQRSGVAWYVDDRRVRHWIPDGEVFSCVGGDDVLVPFDLPGYAIWSLERGEPARCQA